MLSKEEIEKAKKVLYPLSIGDFITWFTTDRCIEVEIATKTILKYIEQLESDRQKLIEKLEERKKQNDNKYGQAIDNNKLPEMYEMYEIYEIHGRMKEDNYILSILKG